MGMSPHIGDRERDKFVQTEEGDTAVRVIPVENPVDEEVNVKLDEEYRLRSLNKLNSINQNLISVIKLLEAIASE